MLVERDLPRFSLIRVISIGDAIGSLACLEFLRIKDNEQWSFRENCRVVNSASHDFVLLDYSSLNHFNLNIVSLIDRERVYVSILRVRYNSTNITTIVFACKRRILTFGVGKKCI